MTVRNPFKAYRYVYRFCNCKGMRSCRIAYNNAVYLPFLYFVICVNRRCRKDYRFTLFDRIARMNFRIAYFRCDRTTCAVYAKGYLVCCRRLRCYVYLTARCFTAVFARYRDNRFSNFVCRYRTVFINACNIRLIRTPRYCFVCCVCRRNRCSQLFTLACLKRQFAFIKLHLRYRYGSRRQCLKTHLYLYLCRYFMAIRCTYIICRSSTVDRPLFYFITLFRHRSKYNCFVFLNYVAAANRFTVYGRSHSTVFPGAKRYRKGFRFNRYLIRTSDTQKQYGKYQCSREPAQ